MFSSWIALVALALEHIVHVYLRAWYTRDGISLELVKIESALKVDDVMLLMTYDQQGFVMKVVRPIDLMIVAHFVVGATRFGLTSLDVLLLPPPTTVGEGCSFVNDSIVMNVAYDDADAVALLVATS